MRISFLNRLVKADGDITEIEKGLASFEWDYDGEPVLLDKSSIRGVLSRFIEGTMTAKLLEAGQRFWNCVKIPIIQSRKKEVASEVMHALANPELEDVLTI